MSLNDLAIFAGIAAAFVSGWVCCGMYFSYRVRVRQRERRSAIHTPRPSFIGVTDE